MGPALAEALLRGDGTYLKSTLNLPVGKLMFRPRSPAPLSTGGAALENNPDRASGPTPGAEASGPRPDGLWTQ